MGKQLEAKRYLDEKQKKYEMTEVQRIGKYRLNNNQVQYEVFFKKYPNQSSWLPADELQNCLGLLQQKFAYQNKGKSIIKHRGRNQNKKILNFRDNNHAQKKPVKRIQQTINLISSESEIIQKASSPQQGEMSMSNFQQYPPSVSNEVDHEQKQQINSQNHQSCKDSVRNSHRVAQSSLQEPPYQDFSQAKSPQAIPSQKIQTPKNNSQTYFVKNQPLNIIKQKGSKKRNYKNKRISDRQIKYLKSTWLSKQQKAKKESIKEQYFEISLLKLKNNEQDLGQFKFQQLLDEFVNFKHQRLMKRLDQALVSEAQQSNLQTDYKRQSPQKQQNNSIKYQNCTKLSPSKNQQTQSSYKKQNQTLQSQQKQITKDLIQVDRQIIMNQIIEQKRNKLHIVNRITDVKIQSSLQSQQQITLNADHTEENGQIKQNVNIKSLQ